MNEIFIFYSGFIHYRLCFDGFEGKSALTAWVAVQAPHIESFALAKLPYWI